MKIAFVNDSSQQLGIQYISSLLTKNGHEVRLFMDPQLFDDEIISVKPLNRLFDYKRRIVSDLKAYKPDLIGVSVVTDFYQWALTMARMIKEELDTPIIFGGIHPTSVPERVIQNDCVDMVCVGEGEYPMLELADSMEKGRLDTSIKNIWFKKDGQVIANEVRPLIEDLESLPLPDTDIYFRLSPHFRKTGLYITMASRGCPNACSYCCHSYIHELYQGKGKNVRQRSVRNVLEELIKVKRDYGIKFIAFMDNCFGYDIKWLKEFTSEYKKKIGIKFWCIMHPNNVCQESLECLKSAGCNTIDMGIQSWNGKIRQEILHRSVQDETMVRAIELVKKAKIELMTDSIFDLPGQTEEDIIDCALHYVAARPNRIYFYMLRYYPGTRITREVFQQNRISHKRYEDLLDGVNVTSFAIGGDQMNRRTLQFQILFYLIDLLPRCISRFIICKKIYRFFPVIFGPAVIVILRNMISFDINARLQRAGAFHRYSYFLIKRIK